MDSRVANRPMAVQSENLGLSSSMARCEPIPPLVN